MGSEKICISKRLVTIAFFSLFFFGGYLMISQRLINSKKILINHASSGKDNLNIIGGEEVKSGEFPSAVYINDGNASCTGVLIGSRWVLTAGHCIGSETPIVTIGSSNIAQFSEALNIRAIMPPFRPLSQTSDIALLLLEKEVNISSFPKLPQPFLDEKLYSEGNDITAIGWGCKSIEPSITPLPGIVQSQWKVCSQAKSRNECNKLSEIYGNMCGYLTICDICIPWEHPEIDYSNSIWNCFSLKNEISRINKDDTIIAVVPQPPDAIKIMSESLRKIKLPINTSQGPNNKDIFKIGYSDKRSLQETTCSGDSGGPTFYTSNNSLYLLGVHSTSFSGTRKGPSTDVRVIESTKWIEEVMNNPQSIPTLMPTPTPRDCREIKDINVCNNGCAWYSCARGEYKCFATGSDVCTN